MPRPPADMGVRAPAQISEAPPILKWMKVTTMTNDTPAAITSIEDAATARWLARKLAPARALVQAEPSEAALERIRARVFGETPRKTRTLAA